MNSSTKQAQFQRRLHQLELLPGIGKKHMWDIINARKEAEFTSFEDIKNRVSMLAEPVKLIAKRVHHRTRSWRRKKRKNEVYTFHQTP